MTKKSLLNALKNVSKSIPTSVNSLKTNVTEKAKDVYNKVDVKDVF